MAIAFSGIGKTLMGSPVIFSGNNAKVLKNNLDLNGVTTILTGPLDPTQTATAGNKGSMYLSTLTGLVYSKKDSGTTTNWSRPVSGSKNYFELSNANPTFENNSTAPWVPVSTTFTNGVPGALSLSSGNFVLSINAGAPLSGSADLAVTKPAVNAQGSGFASGLITVDREDSAKILYGSFSFASNSTNFDASGGSTQSLEIWIYDVTNNVWIQPTGYRGMNQNVGAGKCAFSFQTPYFTVTNQFRFCIFTNQTSALNYAVEFDNFVLGPQAILTGTVVTDWQSYTPTGSWTNATYTGRFRRVGDELEFQVGISLTGSPAGGNLSVTIPSGLSVDTTKFSLFNTGNYPVVGQGGGLNPGVAGYIFEATLLTVNSVLITYQSTNSANAAAVSQTAPITWVNGQSLHIRATVPIVGWSSNVQMSSDSDQRVLRSAMNLITANQSIGATLTKVAFNNTLLDKNAAIDIANSRYVVRASGSYTFTPNLGLNQVSTTGSVNVYLYKNGAPFRSAPFYITGGTNYFFSVSWDDDAAAGDFYEVFVSTSAATVTVFSTASTYGGSSFEVKKQGNPATIAQSDSVNFKAIKTSSQSLPATTDTPVIFDLAKWDSHGQYNSTNGRYTVSVPGKYRASTCVAIDTSTLGTYTIIYHKNAAGGTVDNAWGRFTAAANGTQYMSVTSTFNMLPGDYLYVNANPQSAATVVNDARTHFEAERVGN